jgi:hypothetical protein
LYREPERLQTFREARGGAARVVAVEVVNPEIVILDAVAEDEIRGGQQRRGDGDDGFPGPAPGQRRGVELAILQSTKRAPARGHSMRCDTSSRSNLTTGSQHQSGGRPPCQRPARRTCFIQRC